MKGEILHWFAVKAFTESSLKKPVNGL